MASIGKVKRLVIHHSAGSRDKSTAAGIRRWHKTPKSKGGPGWSDIGYHKVIRGSGLLENGISETTRGTHVKNGNTGALGVCVTGHFGKVHPTKAQLNTLIELLAKWCRTHGLTSKDIYGHHNIPVGVKKPACPGKNMVSQFSYIKRGVDRINKPKYILSKRVTDPTVRRHLEKALENDQRLKFEEVHEILFSVIGDGKVSGPELQSMKAIAKHSKSLRGEGRKLLRRFLKNPKKFVEENTPGLGSPDSKPRTPAQRADEAFFKRHPERKGKPLTKSKADAALRREWLALYRQYGGK